MHNPIKAVFFDVDGTLFSHALNAVPESTKEALYALREKEIKTVVVTGRDMTEFSKLPVSSLPFDGYLTLNGQLLFDEEHNLYGGRPIDKNEMQILAGIFRAKKIPFVLIGDHKRYINFINDTVIKTQEETKGTIPPLGSYSGEKIYQILAFVPPETKEFLDELLDECAITSWNDTGIDIIPRTGGKDAGIQMFLERYGFDRTSAMAFGDGENDIAMLKFVGVGVAMGNAASKVKEAADYVTDSVDEDGIKNALVHFGLI